MMKTGNRREDMTKTRRENKKFLGAQFGFPRHWDEADVKYADGSSYRGHLTRHGERTGFGTYRTPVDVYEDGKFKSLSCWHEYTGHWRDNKPDGEGRLSYVCVCGDGQSTVKYEGKWLNGQPVKAKQD
jgi:hypothetical protein